jgi:hypothetical protein
MPPQVEVTRMILRGQEKMTAEEQSIIQRLPHIVGNELEKRGFEARRGALEEERFEEAPELRFETTQIQRAYDRVSDEMYRMEQMPPEEALHYECTLGPDITLFSHEAEADALVFVRFKGWEKSGGERAKDILITVLVAIATGMYAEMPKEAAVLELALVDGTTGEVLWANRVSRADGVAISDMVEDAFEEFPW